MSNAKTAKAEETAIPRRVASVASLLVDVTREEKGDWIEYPAWPGVFFKVSSIQSDAYQIARDKAFVALSRKHKGEVPPSIRTCEIGRLYCEHILHDWKGLDVEYSPEQALDILAHPKGRRFVEAIEYCAARLSDADVIWLEEEAKN